MRVLSARLFLVRPSFFLRLSARKAAALLAGRRCSTNAQLTSVDEQRMQHGTDVRFNVRPGQVRPAPARQPRIDECFSPARVPMTGSEWLADLARFVSRTPPLPPSEPGVLLSAFCWSCSYCTY